MRPAIVRAPRSEAHQESIKPSADPAMEPRVILAFDIIGSVWPQLVSWTGL